MGAGDIPPVGPYDVRARRASTRSRRTSSVALLKYMRWPASTAARPSVPASMVLPPPGGRRTARRRRRRGTSHRQPLGAGLVEEPVEGLGCVVQWETGQMSPHLLVTVCFTHLHRRRTHSSLSLLLRRRNGPQAFRHGDTVREASLRERGLGRRAADLRLAGPVGEGLQHPAFQRHHMPGIADGLTCPRGTRRSPPGSGGHAREVLFTTVDDTHSPAGRRARRTVPGILATTASCRMSPARRTGYRRRTARLPLAEIDPVGSARVAGPRCVRASTECARRGALAELAPPLAWCHVRVQNPACEHACTSRERPSPPPPDAPGFLKGCSVSRSTPSRKRLITAFTTRAATVSPATRSGGKAAKSSTTAMGTIGTTNTPSSTAAWSAPPL